MKIQFKPWTVPIAIAAACILSYALLIPTLGFYWDDWPFLISAKLQGPEGFYEFFQFDRPTTHYSYLVFMPLLGTNPVLWQVFSLLLRWLTAVMVWWTIGKLWPNSSSLAAGAALIFAVHPIFRQQQIAMTYHQLWMEYLFYVISIGAMVAAVRSPKRYWLWLITALAGISLNFLISEYFLGVELLRPLIIGIVLWPSIRNLTLLTRLKTIFLHWLPFLLVLAGYLVWRFILVDLPGEDRNAPKLLSSLLTGPFAAGLQLLQMAIQDFVYILVTNWYETIRPDIFDFTSKFNLAALGITVACTILFSVFLFYHNRQCEDGMAPLPDARAASLLGLILVLVAPLPGWVTHRQVTVGAFSDRLAVPAMLGASLALAGGIAWLIRGRLQQIIMISLLVGLAAGQNLRVANDYRWARVQANRLYWQFYWRAPALEPETAVFSEGEILSKMGLYSTASGLNLVYAETAPTGDLPYWYFALGREFGHRIPELLAGIPLEKTFRQFSFRGSSHDSLVIYFESRGDCLRVLLPEDTKDPSLTPIMVQALPISNLARILPKELPGSHPSEEIFGPEPERGWCYIFQKADLARQEKDWQQVVKLGDEASAEGYSLDNLQSNTPQEWIPFIEGYAHTGRWRDAATLNEAILEKEPKMAPRLCDLWKLLEDSYPSVPEVIEVRDKLGCTTAN